MNLWARLYLNPVMRYSKLVQLRMCLLNCMAAYCHYYLFEHLVQYIWLDQLEIWCNLVPVAPGSLSTSSASMAWWIKSFLPKIMLSCCCSICENFAKIVRISWTQNVYKMHFFWKSCKKTFSFVCKMSFSFFFQISHKNQPVYLYSFNASLWI